MIVIFRREECLFLSRRKEQLLQVSAAALQLGPELTGGVTLTSCSLEQPCLYTAAITDSTAREDHAELEATADLILPSPSWAAYI